MSEWLITTVRERCRMCYTCVRECPAKAIRIADGQAEVIAERCIGCGNCVQVCSQGAKQIRSSIEDVRRLMAEKSNVCALVAPSFPAAFCDATERQIVGMLRAVGFRRVHEVAFGADLVARRYADLLKEGGARHIASNCPAVVGLIERYYPELVQNLAPIVSPMVATARYVRRLYGEGTACVFIGPCVAKKAEADSTALGDEVDSVLTFEEIQAWFLAAGIDSRRVAPSDFDPPQGGRGGLFAVCHGALQAAGIAEDLLEGEVIAAHGRTQVVEAIRELASGDLGVRLLEALCCDGCIVGPGISNTLPLFNRHGRVRAHVARRMAELDHKTWAEAMDAGADLDLSRSFTAQDQRVVEPAEDDIRRVLSRMGKRSVGDELNCGACGYDTCREHAVAVLRGLAETEMCLPHMVGQLRIAIEHLERSHRELTTTQTALMESEKLARMGQMAAGIAHEINNPLAVILMYSHLLLDEMSEQIPLYEDLRLIAEQANRCKKIVGGLLDISRYDRAKRETCDIRSLLETAVTCACLPERIRLKTDIRLVHATIEVDRDQMVNVITNLLSNAVDAIEREGTIELRAEDDEHELQIAVIDSGAGISPEHRKHVFEPFFTTKEAGRGTGLGLAVVEQTVKMHNGAIEVRSNGDPAAGPTGTTFIIALPRHEG